MPLLDSPLIAQAGAHYQETTLSLDGSFFLFSVCFVCFLYVKQGLMSLGWPQICSVSWDYRFTLLSWFMYPVHSFCSQHLEWSTCSSAEPWKSSKSPQQHGDAEHGCSERVPARSPEKLAAGAEYSVSCQSSIQPFPRAALASV